MKVNSSKGFQNSPNCFIILGDCFYNNRIIVNFLVYLSFTLITISVVFTITVPFVMV